ncbi:MAG: hypothetical protein LBQ52_10225 [Helicobacteraceae bacterium]|jgi:amino acid permease|nr:hypothetical protein [Helicobacteraceae bacterium]
MSKFFGQNPYLWSLIYAPIAALVSLYCGTFVGVWVGYRSFVYFLPIIALASMGYIRAKKFEVIDSYSKTYLALFLPMFIGSALYAFSDVFGVHNTSAHIPQTWLETLSSLLFAAGFIYSIGFVVGLYRKKQRVVNKKPIYYSIAAILAFIACFAFIATSSNFTR